MRVCLLIHDLLPATSQRWFADAQGRAAKDDIETLIAAADVLGFFRLAEIHAAGQLAHHQDINAVALPLLGDGANGLAHIGAGHEDAEQEADHERCRERDECQTKLIDLGLLSAE